MKDCNTLAFLITEKLLQNPNNPLWDNAKSNKENAEQIVEFITHITQQLRQQGFTIHPDHLKGICGRV